MASLCLSNQISGTPATGDDLASPPPAVSQACHKVASETLPSCDLVPKPIPPAPSSHHHSVLRVGDMAAQCLGSNENFGTPATGIVVSSPPPNRVTSVPLGRAGDATPWHPWDWGPPLLRDPPATTTHGPADTNAGHTAPQHRHRRATRRATSPLRRVGIPIIEPNQDQMWVSRFTPTEPEVRLSQPLPITAWPAGGGTWWCDIGRFGVLLRV